MSQSKKLIIIIYTITLLHSEWSHCTSIKTLSDVWFVEKIKPEIHEEEEFCPEDIPQLDEDNLSLELHGSGNGPESIYSDYYLGNQDDNFDINYLDDALDSDCENMDLFYDIVGHGLKVDSPINVPHYHMNNFAYQPQQHLAPTPIVPVRPLSVGGGYLQGKRQHLVEQFKFGSREGKTNFRSNNRRQQKVNTVERVIPIIQQMAELEPNRLPFDGIVDSPRRNTQMKQLRRPFDSNDQVVHSRVDVDSVENPNVGRSGFQMTNSTAIRQGTTDDSIGFDAGVNVEGPTLPLFEDPSRLRDSLSRIAGVARNVTNGRHRTEDPSENESEA